MNTELRRGHEAERGVGLIEVMISIVIAMLLVLVIYQIYEVSEGQKRTITAGSDAQQNASYGLFMLGRDIAVAGNGIASATDGDGKAVLDGCAMLRPIPVLIEAGAGASDPDTVTVLYGGSSSLSTPVPFRNTATTADTYVVPGPVGFSADPADPDKTDVIVAVQGATCTMSKIKPGGVAVNAVGEATLTHTPVTGDMGVTYTKDQAALVNLGQPTSMGRIVYSVDPTTRALRTRKQLPTNDPVSPLVSDVVNLKAQYGLDTDNDGAVDTWQDATGGVWSAANLRIQPLATIRQIRAVRIAIVTRSAQYEKDAVTEGPLTMFDGANAVSMNLGPDDQHYRYRVLETVVPLRNAIWNAP